MEALKSFILRTLPSLPEDTLAKVLERLQNCGVEDLTDFRYVKEEDLNECLKAVQIRKLLEQYQQQFQAKETAADLCPGGGLTPAAEAVKVEGRNEASDPKVAEGNGTLTRAAMGRQARVGDIYDVRSDSFTGQSLCWNAGTPSIVGTWNKLETAEYMFEEDTLVNRVIKLRIENELQLSCTVGLAQARGSTDRFINDGCPKTESVKGCMLYKMTTVNERYEDARLSHLEPCGESEVNVSINTSRRDSKTRRPPVTSQASDQKATHFVAGIEWGAQVVVIIEHTDVFYSGRQAIESDLKTRLKMLFNSCKQASDHAALANANDKYIVTILSDFIGSNEETQSYSDALFFLKQQLPTRVKAENNGKGIPLSYQLVPLWTLNHEERRKDGLCRNITPIPTIDEITVKNVLKLFDILLQIKCYFNNIMYEMKVHEYCLLPSDISVMCCYNDGFDKAVKELRSSLATHILEYRSATVELSHVTDVIDRFQQSEFSIKNVMQFLEQNDRIFDKMRFIDAALKEDVSYISKDVVEVGDLVKKSAEVYILFASQTSICQNKQLWNENCCTFFWIINQVKDKLTRRRMSSKENSGTIRNVIFAFVDCDFISCPTYTDRIAIHRYVNGKCKCSDVAEEQAFIASLNIARSSMDKEPVKQKPSKRAVLEMPCPGSLTKCQKSQRIWSCKRCREQLEYGFDDYFYCSCGRAPCGTFYFCCNDQNHDRYVVCEREAMQEFQQKLVPVKEITILFLGETGVGKSTWINGFANYITFSTMEEAETGDTVCPIPVTFTMTNEHFKEVQISTGTDKNEEFEVGSSATQMPKTYLFRKNNTIIRIIDTPGIGDTRGIDYDKKNMQNILDHLSNLEEVNGICILLKPNNARLTVMFSFCIKELLTHLHRGACKNIVFCFTNARSTFYRPGDTLPALRKLLAENPDVEIKLDEATMYCIDNEAVRFLAAIKQGIVFGETEKENYRTSWLTSVRETQRMVGYISSLEPHKLKDTLSLNDARRLIVALSRPLAEISSTIESNIGAIEERRMEIMESNESKEGLVRNLYIPAIDLTTTSLSHPRTVCTSDRCVEHLSVGDVIKTDYKQHCHPHCRIRGAPTNTLNCAALKRCSAMSRTSPYMCKKCDCPWTVHMHITYECQQVLTEIVDPDVQKQIDEKTTHIQVIETHLNTLKARMTEMENEKKSIVEISAKFACFLKCNAIAPYNDALADYMDHLIRLERGKVIVGGGINRKLEGLEKMRHMYKDEIQILETAIRDQSSIVWLPSSDDIDELVDCLYKLRHSGPMLAKVMEVAERASIAAMRYSEEKVQPQRKSRRPRQWCRNMADIVKSLLIGDSKE